MRCSTRWLSDRVISRCTSASSRRDVRSFEPPEERVARLPLAVVFLPLPLPLPPEPRPPTQFWPAMSFCGADICNQRHALSMKSQARELLRDLRTLRGILSFKLSESMVVWKPETLTSDDDDNALTSYRFCNHLVIAKALARVCHR